MKSLLENIIQKRNPAFQFDKAITFGMLLELAFSRAFQLIRSYKFLWRGITPNMWFFGKAVKLEFASNIFIGKWVKLGDYCHLSGLSKDGLYIGDKTGIGAHSHIVVSTSFNNLGESIYIGDNVGIGEFAYLGGGGGLIIGDDCIIGQYFSCHPENHNFNDNTKAIRLQGVSRKGINIGNNCWIGSKVTILDGVSIGDNCVIAAGAVVNKSMPSNSVIGGVPAKVLKNIQPENINNNTKLKAI